MAKKQASQAEMAMRVNDVFNMMVEGKSSATIFKKMSEKYGISLTSVVRDKAKAMKILKKQLAGKKEEKISLAIAQREMLLEKLVESKNYAVSAQLLQDSAKLMNLYEKDDVAAAPVAPQLHFHQIGTREQFEQLEHRDTTNDAV